MTLLLLCKNNIEPSHLSTYPNNYNLVISVTIIVLPAESLLDRFVAMYSVPVFYRPEVGLNKAATHVYQVHGD